MITVSWCAKPVTQSRSDSNHDLKQKLCEGQMILNNTSTLDLSTLSSRISKPQRCRI